MKDMDVAATLHDVLSDTRGVFDSPDDLAAATEALERARDMLADLVPAGPEREAFFAEATLRPDDDD